MEKEKPLKITLFSDGRPGHEKQSRGIIEHLRKMAPAEVVTRKVHKPNFFRQLISFVSFIVGRLKPPEGISDSDILIGTGTHTHLPMLAAKKAYGMFVVTCMTPGKLMLNKFDLVFAPVHDNPDEKRDNIFPTIGPPNENQNMRQHSNDNVLILVGGTDPKYLRWDQDRILASVQSILHADSQKIFIISSSPRTPSATEEMLEDMVEGIKNVQFFKFENTEKGWVENQYRTCKTVWVTGDSVSMVYEALSSGCRVGIIPVHWLKKKSKFSRSENLLREKGIVLDLDTHLAGDNEQLADFDLQEAKRCAEEILRRFG